MPELPEVETVRRTLQQLVVGKTVERVTVRLPRIVQHPDDIEIFAALLVGETIRSVERRGKFFTLHLRSLYARLPSADGRPIRGLPFRRTP